MTNEEVRPFGNLNTFEQASERLNVHPRTVRRLVDRGELRVIRVTANRPRIADLDIERFIAAKAGA
jgi:excisionase family DNA binding protein